jgi:hypothetical protein
MNAARAREFFSERFEGTLDEGLKQAFDRAVEQSPELKADYLGFCSMMRALPELSPEAAAVPQGLHAAIMDRVLAAEASARRPFWNGPRIAWAAGLACLALATVMILPRLSPDQPAVRASMADLVSGQGPRFVPSSTGLEFVYPGRPGEVLIVKDAAGNEVDIVELTSTQAEVPLFNHSTEAQVVQIMLADGRRVARIALPGSGPAQRKDGRGSEAEMAAALAQASGRPVILDAEAAGVEISWIWGAGEPVAALRESAEAEGFSIEERANGMLALIR